MTKLGPRPKWTDERDADLAACLKEGFDDAEIARRLGVSPGAVLHRRNVLGLTREAPTATAGRRALCPSGITAPIDSDAWWRQNHESFCAGWQRAAAGEAHAGGMAEPSTGAPSGAREQRPS